MADALRADTGNSRGKAGFNLFLTGDFKKNYMAMVVIVGIAMFIFPLPTVLLDFFITINLVLSIIVLLTVLYNQRPTDFSLFPTILLLLTVFSLALNISSTRAILTQGTRFDGRMIKAFSTFVVGSEGMSGLVVGAIIFIIIIIVQVVVITKGSTRISEVAARFSLDALPGKQMAIDQEYASGGIDQREATARKEALQRESDFYGAMDGASKFIANNVKVGVFIILIDVIGGVIIGALVHGESIASSLGIYASLTIGDGLVSQLPALLISTALGVVVTRAAAPGDLTEQVSIQFTKNPAVYAIGAAIVFGLGWLPGFPKYVLFPMSVFLGYFAYHISQKKRKQDDNDRMAKTGESTRKPKDEKADIPQMEPLDHLSLELGYGLIPLVDKDRGAELLDRMHQMRRQIGLDMGIVIPKIRIIDNISLNSYQYCFKIRGVDVGKSTIRMGYFLCINPGTAREELSGEKTQEPAFGLPAIWVSADRQDEAVRAGYTVVDPPSLITTHITEIIKNHAAELLGRQETQSIIDGLRKDYPAVVEEVFMGRDGKGITLGNVQKVLQGLLKEQVSIRNTVPILESIADFAPLTNDTRFLIENARQALSSQICHQFADENRVLHVLTLEPSLEKKIAESKVQNTSGDIFSALEPALHNAWIKALDKSIRVFKTQGYYPVILSSYAARYLIRTALDKELPEVAVLSVAEISQDYKVEYVGVISLDKEQKE